MTASEWADLNYERSDAAHLELAYFGVGGSWAAGHTNYAKRIIGIVDDLPYMHHTNQDGYCNCPLFTDIHYGWEREIVEQEFKPKRRPYVWL